MAFVSYAACHSGDDEPGDGGSGDAGEHDAAIDGGTQDGGLDAAPQDAAEPDAMMEPDTGLEDSATDAGEDASADAHIEDDGGLPDADAGDDDAGHVDAGTDNAAPQVELHFPIGGVTDAASIAVRGRVSDPDGDAIVQVLVNGAPVTIDTHGEYSTAVALVQARNAIDILATDERGESGSATVTVTRAPIWSSARPLVVSVPPNGWQEVGVTDLVVDPSGQSVFTADSTSSEVLAVDLETGFPTTIKPPLVHMTGERPMEWPTSWFALDLFGARGVAVDWETGETYVLGNEEPVANGTLMSSRFPPPSAIIAIDPETRERRTLWAEVTAFGGSSCGADGDIAFDAANGRVLHACGFGSRDILVRAIDPETREVTQIADFTVPWLAEVKGLAVGEDGETVLVLAGGQDTLGLHAIDLATGEITVIADDVTGTGPSLASTRNIAADFEHGRAFIAGGDILEVDLATGDRHFAYGSIRGDGPAAGSVQGLALDRANGRLLGVSDLGITAFDLQTGDRTRLVSRLPQLADVPVSADFASNGTGRVLFYADGTSLESFELATGEIREVSGATRGVGPTWSTLSMLEPSANADGLMLYADDSFFHVDLTTGDRTQAPTGDVALVDVAAITTSSGDVLAADRGEPEEYVGSGFTVPHDTPEALLEDAQGSVVRVSFGTGERTVLSSAADAAGAGPELWSPCSIGIDAARDRALVADCAAQTLYAIALDNGDRTPLAYGHPYDATFRPIDVLIDGDWIAVVDLTGAVMLVDPETGERSLVSGKSPGSEVSRGNGPDVLGPPGASVSLGHGVIMIHDVFRPALIAIDLTSGDSVAFAR